MVKSKTDAGPLRRGQITDGATFRIARRHIALDQGTLLTSSLSFFF